MIKETPAPSFTAAPHPGEILMDFLDEYALTPNALAGHLGVNRQRIYEIARGKRPITTDTAARLGRLFSTSAQYWLNLQASYDLAQMDPRDLEAIEPLTVAE